MKLEFKVKVKNTLGLHTRPAAAIVKMLQSSKSNVQFVCKGETINARSIMSILMLAAKKNMQLTVLIEGADAENTKEHLLRGFDTSFGEG